MVRASPGRSARTSGRRSACRSQVAAIATCIALVFGTLAAAALSRAKFFGRETISLLFVLPIALPGIITGISLRSAFDLDGHPLLVLDHRARPRHLLHRRGLQQCGRAVPPLSPSLIEASMDLGADGFQTFRHVSCPISARRCSPAACSPSRCPSTR